MCVCVWVGGWVGGCVGVCVLIFSIDKLFAMLYMPCAVLNIDRLGAS